MKEIKLIKKINKMCMQSLSPDQFSKWEHVRDILYLTRKKLKK
jgi:hypothetical protein